MSEQTVYSCVVQEVFSGDDLIAMVDLKVENLFKRQRIRLHGVDTPPAVGVQDNAEAGQIRTFVRAVTRNKKATLTIVSRNKTSWVVNLIVDSGTPEGLIDVNALLVAKGYQFKR